jgi:hypothetical protein
MRQNGYYVPSLLRLGIVKLEDVPRCSAMHAPLEEVVRDGTVCAWLYVCVRGCTCACVDVRVCAWLYVCVRGCAWERGLSVCVWGGGVFWVCGCGCGWV